RRPGTPRPPPARRSPGHSPWRPSPSRPPSHLQMILTDRARSLVHWCDGEQSKLRMQEPKVEISRSKIGNSGSTGGNRVLTRTGRRHQRRRNGGRRAERSALGTRPASTLFLMGLSVRASLCCDRRVPDQARYRGRSAGESCVVRAVWDEVGGELV